LLLALGLLGLAAAFLSPPVTTAGQVGAAQAPPQNPGAPAPSKVVEEVRLALAQAVHRFNARDQAGALAYVSDQYRTGPLTKPAIRAQLLAMFDLYEELRARVRIDEVRMVGDLALIYSTGEVVGLLPWVRAWMLVLSWEREPEVARKEQGVWRLIGFQQ
jgi:hypothetical protein